MRMKIGVLVPLRMDILGVPKFLLGWARTSNFLSRVLKEYIHYDKYDSDSDSPKHEFIDFF